MKPHPTPKKIAKTKTIKKTNPYKVVIQCVSSNKTIPSSAHILNWATTCLYTQISKAEVAIRIVNKKESHQLNFQYRGKNKPTNVLSFPADIPPGVSLAYPLLGDIIICAPVVAAEALEQKKDAKAHWAHMVIHGLLHLLGYDHNKAAQAKVMENLETRILQILEFPDPYGDEVYE